MKKNIKNICIPLFITAILSFHCSCTEKEDGRNGDYSNYANLITGEWICTEATQNGIDNPNGVDVRWFFEEGGTLTIISPLIGRASYDYLVDGNRITVSYGGITAMAGTIKNITSSNLFIEWYSPYTATNRFERI